ncbi:MAG: cytidylate kinase, partial [Nostocoides sp.]
SEEARLRRRSTELHGDADANSVARTRDQIVKRDAADATMSEFTVAADGVTAVDTSDLDFDASVAAVLAVVRAAGGSRS